MSLAASEFVNAKKCLEIFMQDESNIQRIEDLALKIAQCFQSGGKIMFFGNGGSCADAAHAAEEFVGRYRSNRRPLPALAFSDGPTLTCIGNDFGYDNVFNRMIEAYAQKGDVAVGLSTSGNSKNIITAIQQAQTQGCTTVCLLGKGGGESLGLADYEWVAPGDTSDRIQEIHMQILHILIACVESRMFPELYRVDD